MSNFYRPWDKNDETEQQDKVTPKRSLFDNVGDAITAIGANFTDVRSTGKLGDLREELMNSGTLSDEEFEQKLRDYNEQARERQQARDIYQAAHQNLVNDDSFLKNVDQLGGTLEGMAAQGIGTAVGAGLGFLSPVVGGTALGAKWGNAAGAIAGGYLDARSVALQAEEDVLNNGGTWEQAKRAYDETLKKASLTTLPETAVDIALGSRLIGGALNSKAARKIAGSTLGRVGSSALDAAEKVGTKAAFKSGSTLVGRGAGILADTALQGGTEALQEVGQDYIANREVAKAMGNADNEYSLGGFGRYMTTPEGLETMKTAGIMGALFGGVGGTLSSGQYLQRGAETKVGIDTHNAIQQMEKDGSLSLNKQARSELEAAISVNKGISRAELSSWSDSEIVAESAVIFGEQRSAVTGEDSDVSQIREAVDTLVRLSKDPNSITRESEINGTTKDFLNRMGYTDQDINGWFSTPSEVMERARQDEEKRKEEQQKKQEDGTKEQKIKLTENTADGAVKDGKLSTKEEVEVAGQNKQSELHEAAKQAEQEGKIDSDIDKFPDAIRGWQMDYDASEGYEGATYYNIGNDKISARIEPVDGGYVVSKVDEKGVVQSDSKNIRFATKKDALDYLTTNKDSTVFQKSNEQLNGETEEVPPGYEVAGETPSGKMVGSVDDLYNLMQEDPTLITPYEFAEFVRIKQHMGAGDIDIYFSQNRGLGRDENGKLQDINAYARRATAKSRAIIQLYRGGDLGSAIHELAHVAFWNLSQQDQKTFCYYAVKTQGRYIADSLNEDYTPDFENRLLNLAGKLINRQELDELDKQLYDKIQDNASTNQIQANIITFYNYKRNGEGFNLDNLSVEQQRAIEERWAWEMSQWYLEGYMRGVNPDNIVNRIKQRGCESIAQDLNSILRIWKHIHGQDNGVDNLYRGGRNVGLEMAEQGEVQPTEVVQAQETPQQQEQYTPNFTMEEGERAKYTGNPNFVMYNGRKTREVVPYNSSVGQPRVEPYTGPRDITTQGGVQMNDTTADALAAKIFNRYKENPKMVGAALDNVFRHAHNEQEQAFAQNVAKRVLERMNGYYGGQTQYENGIFYAGHEQEREQTKQEPVPAEGQKTKRRSPRKKAKEQKSTNIELPRNETQLQAQSQNGTTTENQQQTEQEKPKKTMEQKPTKQEVKQEQPKEQEKPTIPTDEIYSHLYFGDKTGKLKYNKDAKKIEYFAEEYVGRNPDTMRKMYKTIKKGEITQDQYNELRTRYEQDFKKVKSDEKSYVPDLVEGLKKDDFMYAAYKELKETSKDKEEKAKKLGEDRDVIKDKGDAYSRTNALENQLSNIGDAENISNLEETELTKEQKEEAKQQEKELKQGDKEKEQEEKKEQPKTTKKTTNTKKETDPLAELHKKYKYITGTPIGEKRYRYTDNEKQFISQFKNIIDEAVGDKEKLLSAEKQLDKWFQNTPTERNRMVRKYLTEYLIDAGKIKIENKTNNQQFNKAEQAREILDKAFPNTVFQFAWHGSGYNFNRFTLEHIGEGEGAAAHGWGLYFGKDWATGEKYANVLQRKGNGKGYIYKVEVPDDIKLLSEDGLLKNNSKEVIEKLKKVYNKYFKNSIYSGVPFSAIFNRWSGKKFMIELDDIINFENKKNGIKYIKGKSASLALKEFGIDGHYYTGGLDGKCCVIWNDQAVKLLEKYDRESGETTKSGEGIEKRKQQDNGIRFQAASAKRIGLNEKVLDKQYYDDFSKIGKNLGYSENEINQAMLIYATGGSNLNINTKGKDKYARIFVRIDNKINADLWKKGKNIQRGLDGKWRFYIDDRKSNIKSGVDKLLSDPDKINNRKFPLGQILNHKELFKYYPELKNIKVEFKKMDGALGQVFFHGKTPQIEINQYKIRTTKELMDTLLHEIQHYIQYEDGFAKGGNKTEFKDTDNRLLFSALTEDVLSDKQKIVDFAKKNEYPITKKIVDQILNMDDFSFMEHWDENSTLGVILNDYVDLNRKDFDAYYNLFGEIEARDATLRYNLSDEYYNKIKPLNLDNRYKKIVDNKGNATIRFQKSNKTKEEKQQKREEVKRQIKEAQEKGEVTDTYKDVYSVTFTKSAQEYAANNKKMEYFEKNKNAWNKDEDNGKVIYTRKNPYNYHTKTVTYNGLNEVTKVDKEKSVPRKWLEWMKDQAIKYLFNDKHYLAKAARKLHVYDAYKRMVVVEGYAMKANTALTQGIKSGGITSRALNDIIREVGEEKQQDFIKYCIAKRVLDLKNREHPVFQKLSPEEAQKIIEEVESGANSELFKKNQADFVQYNMALLHVLVDGGILSEEQYKKFCEQDPNFVPLAKVMDDADFDFNSILSAHNYVNIKSPIKKIGSSMLETKNPFLEMQKRTAEYYAIASRNKAGQIFVNEIANHLDVAVDGTVTVKGNGLIRKVKVKEENGKLITKPDDKKQIIYVCNNGKHEFYQIADREVYLALKSLNSDQMSTLEKMLGGIARFNTKMVREGATMVPDFGIRNFFRDQGEAFITSEHGYIPFIDAAWGIYQVLNNTEWAQAYFDQNGEFGTLVRDEINSKGIVTAADVVDSKLNPVTNIKTLGSKNWKAFRDTERSWIALTDLKKGNYQEALEKTKDGRLTALVKFAASPLWGIGKSNARFNELLELGTRVGEFKNAKMGYQGTLGRLRSNKKTSMANAENSDVFAAYASKEITLNFSQHGIVGKWLNRYIPFFNATLQGIYKLFNTFGAMATGETLSGEINRSYQKELLFKAALITACAIGVAAAGDGDEDYEEAPDYEKNNFWILPNGLRIAKDQMFGKVIGSNVELAYAQWKKGKAEPSKILKNILDEFKPNTIPAILDIFVGGVANYDTFRNKPIVPEYMLNMNLPGRMQKDLTTSNVAKDISEGLWKAFGLDVSAKKVDWAIQKNLSNCAKYAQALYDFGTGRTNEKMERGYDKNDSTGAFVAGLKDSVPPGLNLITGTFATNRTSFKSISDFYERHKELQKLSHDEASMTKEEKREWKRYKQAYEKDKAFRKQLRAIKGDRSLTGAQKRERADKIFKQQIKLAKWAEG